MICYNGWIICFNGYIIYQMDRYNTCHCLGKLELICQKKEAGAVYQVKPFNGKILNSVNSSVCCCYDNTMYLV